jgi:hypothetical protein
MAGGISSSVILEGGGYHTAVQTISPAIASPGIRRRRQIGSGVAAAQIKKLVGNNIFVKGKSG